MRPMIMDIDKDMTHYKKRDFGANTQTMEISVIDLDVFITGSHNPEAVMQECKKVRFFKIK
jgi:hypothetical protein